MNFKKLKTYFCIFFLLSFIFFSCKTVKNSSPDEYLLNKNLLITDNEKINTEDLKGYIKQKPNRKIFGVLRFHLLVYKIGNLGKENKLKKWMKYTIGEEPVYLDSSFSDKSLKQLKLYLYSKGYFNSYVSRKIKLKKNHKANVFYYIKSGKPYTYKNISYNIEDELIKNYIIKDTANSFIKRNSIYDTDNITKERDRITQTLRNNGYYKFSKEFINFNIDSALGCNKLNIEINIKNPQLNIGKNKDSIINVNHSQYIINNIYIYPDNNMLSYDTIKFDTIKYSVKQRKSTIPIDYFFIYKNKLKIKPKTLTQSIFIKPGDYFNLKDAEQTYNRLSDLKIYKFINISFSEKNSNITNNLYNLLDCKIELTKTPLQYYDIELEGSNSSGDLGIGGNLVYQNKNIFRGAEIFKLKLTGAVEIQKVFNSSKTNNVIQELPFNTFETGANASIELPKFLVPIRQEAFPKYFKPKTTFNVGYNYQLQPNYTRYVTNAYFGYEWKQGSYKKHLLNPLEINSVKILPDSTFISKLINMRDYKYMASYQDHLTSSITYSYIFNNQQLNKNIDFIYFRLNLESSGNTLNLYNKLFKTSKNKNGYYTFFNIRYAQFVKSDAEFGTYKYMRHNTSIAARIYGGIGYAYGNFDVLPIEKSFYCGGANSLRAWQIRSVGPGAYVDSTNNRFDKSGDFKIEANFEYRFPLYKIVHGATFLDAGNVWLLKPNDQFPEGEFKIKNFIDQLAIGTGLGLRFNFSFIILRLDAGIPIKYPSQSINEKWVIRDLPFKEIKYNLAIGYPF